MTSDVNDLLLESTADYEEIVTSEKGMKLTHQITFYTRKSHTSHSSTPPDF